jgi:phage protein U
MLIGSWGPLVFDVSGVGALTFSELTQDASGRWSVHEVINTAPITEFLGPGQDSAEMKIILSKMLGIDPKEEYEQMRQMVREGQNHPLILQGLPLSGNLWYVETISGASSKFAAGTGETLWMELTVNFKEYQ